MTVQPTQGSSSLLFSSGLSGARTSSTLPSSTTAAEELRKSHSSWAPRTAFKIEVSLSEVPLLGNFALGVAGVFGRGQSVGNVAIQVGGSEEKPKVSVRSSIISDFFKFVAVSICALLIFAIGTAVSRISSEFQDRHHKQK